MKTAEYLARVITEAPDQCEIRDARELLLGGDCRRGRQGVPARVALAVPDRVLKAVRGPFSKAKHDLIVVAIPRGALEEPLIMKPSDKRARRIIG